MPAPHSQGVGLVEEGVCFLAVLIGRFGRRGTGLVGILSEVPAAVGHEFGPPAVQCGFKRLFTDQVLVGCTCLIRTG